MQDIIIFGHRKYEVLAYNEMPATEVQYFLGGRESIFPSRICIQKPSNREDCSSIRYFRRRQNISKSLLSDQSWANKTVQDPFIIIRFYIIYTSKRYHISSKMCCRKKYQKSAYFKPCGRVWKTVCGWDLFYVHFDLRAIFIKLVSFERAVNNLNDGEASEGAVYATLNDATGAVRLYDYRKKYEKSLDEVVQIGYVPFAVRFMFVIL